MILFAAIYTFLATISLILLAEGSVDGLPRPARLALFYFGLPALVIGGLTLGIVQRSGEVMEEVPDVIREAHREV